MPSRSPLPKLQTSSLSSDKIDSIHSSLTNPTPRQPKYSKTPSGPLHQIPTSRSFGFRFTATIPPHDSQSFITDNQLTWLTQPPSPSPTTQTSSHSFDRTPQADFVLFPTPSSRPGRRQTELAPVTSSTALNHHSGSASGQQLQRSPHRRDSTPQHFSSVSPYQNPRVRNSIQGIGLSNSSTSPRFSPTGKQQQHINFYASSAPSSSTALKLQTRRPPVPLFPSNSTGNLHQGSQEMAVTYSPDDLISHDFRDYSAEHYVDSDHSPVDYQLFEDSGEFQMSSFAPVNLPAPVQTSNHVQTVSPRDVFMDSLSAPPSSAMTNLSTPGTYSLDSPYMYTSNDTSPMFADDALDADSANWDNLFAVDTASDTNGFSEDTVIHNSIEDVTIPMSRDNSNDLSSPGQSSARGSFHGRHSSVAGVQARKRDKPLPPIKVEDPSDIVAVKRARNTAAARKSRQKKMEKVDEMQQTISRLESEVEKWKKIALRQQQ